MFYGKKFTVTRAQETNKPSKCSYFQKNFIKKKQIISLGDQGLPDLKGEKGNSSATQMLELNRRLENIEQRYTRTLFDFS